jgi:hypothetical protein
MDEAFAPQSFSLNVTKVITGNGMQHLQGQLIWLGDVTAF